MDYVRTKWKFQLSRNMKSKNSSSALIVGRVSGDKDTANLFALTLRHICVQSLMMFFMLSDGDQFGIMLCLSSLNN